MLGRRQVVRHRFLVPAFAGSNPAAPASFHAASVGPGSSAVFLRPSSPPSATSGASGTRNAKWYQTGNLLHRLAWTGRNIARMNRPAAQGAHLFDGAIEPTMAPAASEAIAASVNRPI